MPRLGTPWITACACALAISAQAITCEDTAGPPDEQTRVRIEILEPVPGAVIVPGSPCPTPLRISGLYEVEVPPILHDFYIVIDASGSAGNDSGADVDQDGVFGERDDDSIYAAELTAAQAFVSALDPALARVAVIVFNRSAVLHHELSADLVSVDAKLEELKGDRTRWSTGYVPAMQAVVDEMQLRGDPLRRVQRCLFLSDGQPDETINEVETKAWELEAEGIVIDSFALGFSVSLALERMAEITGGRFAALAVPGDIIALLPDFVPEVPRTPSAANLVTGESGDILLDEASGTFEADVLLHPGTNELEISIAVEGDHPLTVSCVVTVELDSELLAEAGPDLSACVGAQLELDASASSIRPCSDPVYTWMLPDGTPLCSGPDPLCVVELAADWTELHLELSCEGAPCSVLDSLAVSVEPAPELTPSLTRACGLELELDCGAPGLDAAWDLDVGFDSDGDGDPANDADVDGCAVTVTVGLPGPRTLAVRAAEPGSGCVGWAQLDVVATSLPEPADRSGGACPGQEVTLVCPNDDPALTLWWDLDLDADSDLDGDPENDRDVLGCEAPTSWSEPGSVRVAAWSENAEGCRWQSAVGQVEVSEDARPGGILDLRLLRVGEELHFSWTAPAGAVSAHVTSAPLRQLHEERHVGHGVDVARGHGACARGPGGPVVDFDDALDGEDRFYLVVTAGDCGGESHAGFGYDGRGPVPRPARDPTPGCP